MAKARRDAVNAVEEEENAKAFILPPDVRALCKDELYGSTPPSQPKESQLHPFPKAVT